METRVCTDCEKAARIHQDLTNLWEARNESKQEIESKLKRCVVV
tara:strand:- start:443 stop:574 length:132 start_codon:yes stop_codon:yes gene_type:complete